MRPDDQRPTEPLDRLAEDLLVVYVCYVLPVIQLNTRFAGPRTPPITPQAK